MAGSRAGPWLLLGLAALALAARLPYYQTIPVFTDEVDEAYRSLLVARGQLLPLTNVDAYNGSLWNYLVAAGYWLSGFNLYTARALALAAGVLTVLAGYAFGRDWGGRVGGLVTGLLLSTAATHIVVNSHLGWGNSITPLFTTLAIWTLWRAVRRGGGRLALPLAGICWGLAFQTHPTVLGLLPGAAIFLLWKAPARFRTRQPYLAAGLFLLVNLNLLVYNLATGFGSVAYGLNVTSDYTRGQALSPTVYLTRLGSLLLGLVRHPGGGVDQRQGGAADQILLDPGLWPIALLTLVGLVWQWRRGNPLPVLLLVGLGLLLPLFDGRYDQVQHSRYLAPLWPVLFASVGTLFAAAVRRLRGLTIGRRRAGRVGLALLAAFLVLHPLLYLRTYYEQEGRLGRTNEPLAPTLLLIRELRHDAPVILDDSPQQGSVGLGGGWLSRIMRLALALDGTPYRLVDLDANQPFGSGERCGNQLVMLAIRRPENRQALLDRLQLDPVATPKGTGASLSSYPLYRVLRQADDPGGC